MPPARIKRIKRINRAHTDCPRVESVTNQGEISERTPHQRVVIAGGDRELDMQLVESARDHGIVDECLLAACRAFTTGC
jgi:hypothetical protein